MDSTLVRVEGQKTAAQMYPEQAQEVLKQPSVSICCSMASLVAILSEICAELGVSLTRSQVARFEDDGLADLLVPVMTELSRSLYNVSPLGSFHVALHALCELASLPAAASVMTRHPAWLPRSAHGRAWENECLLGYALSLSLSLSLFPFAHTCASRSTVGGDPGAKSSPSR